MSTTPLTRENSAVVLIDHEVGFSNLVGSHRLAETIGNTVALARTAQVFGLPLVVTAARESDPAGPLYPELKEVLGDHHVIHRAPVFDAFDNEEFAAAIEAAGREKLVMAGIQTDVCLAFTALTALNRGYEVYVVVDASGATTKETHDTAVMRLVQAGAVPVNWLAAASELLRGWVDQPLAPAIGEIVYDNLPPWHHQHVLTASVAELAAKQPGPART
ncbi:isochorismatase family protein [Streptomyces sp. NRRL F-5126]|uniref:isochorismatase family protein n=1 Tax=Streptomyces sp. NRRL F-5126 TaxID=1463857 RepID=UPI0004C8C83E|nr:isochorismatase family protein [Streptomyces sp. NRRL F-5126]